MATNQKETIIIGAGPGGYVAAIRAAQLGQKVTIIEKEYIGGVCLNVGCIPSKALITAGHHFHNAQHSEVFGITTSNVTLDITKMQNWKDTKVVSMLTRGVEGLLKKNKVEIIRGTAVFTDKNHLTVETKDGSKNLEFKNVVIATGSSPLAVSEVPFGGRVVDTTGGLNIKELPKRLVIVGGGYVATQLAFAFNNFGSKVTILEKEDSIINFFDKDMVKLVKKSYADKGVDVIEGVNITKSSQTDEVVTVTYEKNGKEETIESDYVLVSVGRVPNTSKLNLEAVGVKLLENGRIDVDESLRTGVEGVYAIGDITPGPAFAHKASHDAKIVAEVISGKEVVVNYSTMPIAAYTEPEIASVGMSADEVKGNKEYKVSKFSLAGNGRALSLDATEGFVRMITEKKTNKIVGAQVIGVSAGDVIAELALAIELGMVAEDISLTIHAHPSLAESVMDTAELALGLPIHM
ncbi:dihydrolipoyl dehydrogenase [Carnobacterium viridans]|uniref:Dihydrolipoyl dehydrogenase n=1 Tax=Carnobacterium viridans TaxID=174587 RepID=A0A1H0YCP1_9LACT|nr:dihydrolipoyl dehydrogenase [Carnobacterium viridans]UDE95223.1 dihydrolipoyl dehydrogenase [Carnobacterium viridans]SDQ12656.1 dihydrolipoamide dehydrogenase [Carnobacterium viridans]